MKVLFLILGFIMCAVLGLWPEALMYWSWHLIAPTTEVMRGVTIISFLFLGGGLCIAMASVAVAVYLAIISAVLK